MQWTVVQYKDGGVLLDLLGGGFYRLNVAAAEIAGELLAGKSSGEVSQVIAQRCGIPASTVAADVEALLCQLRQRPAPTSSQNPITFRDEPRGPVLCWQNSPVWRLDPAGRELVYLAPPSDARIDLSTQLLWVVPHVLLLAHRFVLHAAAVQCDANILAFVGPSGLGKSTLAQLLAARGLPLVAGDLLLLSLEHEDPEVFLEGEPFLRRWVAAHADTLSPGARLETKELLAAAAGPRARLDQVFFPYRVSGEARLARMPLPPAEALILFLQNSFAELGQPMLWRYLLEVSRRLVEVTRPARLQVPEGLDRLHAALQDPSWMARS